MTPGIVALLAGLFGVPLVLLVWGHRLREHSARARRAFWGAVAGHGVAAILAVTFGIFPPAEWSESDGVRGFFGLWALLLFPLLAGLAAGGRRPS